MNTVILVAGVAGLAVAAYAFVGLVVDAIRRRQYFDIMFGIGVAVAVVVALLMWGDHLIR